VSRRRRFRFKESRARRLERRVRRYIETLKRTQTRPVAVTLEARTEAFTRMMAGAAEVVRLMGEAFREAGVKVGTAAGHVLEAMELEKRHRAVYQYLSAAPPSDLQCPDDARRRYVPASPGHGGVWRCVICGGRIRTQAVREPGSAHLVYLIVTQTTPEALMAEARVAVAGRLELLGGVEPAFYDVTPDGPRIQFMALRQFERMGRLMVRFTPTDLEYPVDMDTVDVPSRGAQPLFAPAPGSLP
jgi:hypothetical protein